MSQLIQVRTNTRFNLNYETGKLEPEIELIILIGSPTYQVKKGGVVKELGISEIRVNTPPDGITKLIGQLTALQIPVANIENMGSAFNTIIEHSAKSQNKTA